MGMDSADAIASGGKRQALIVAADSYTDPGLEQLRAPARDAEALARVLADPDVAGFNVRTLLNEPVYRLAEVIEEFFAEARRDDLLLLHISCHGLKGPDGELYFASTNTKLARLGSTALDARFVNTQMTRSRSRRIVLLLDCCYSGSFERGMLARARSGLDLEERFGGRGRAVITASSATEYAFEGANVAEADPGPSIFTNALVRGLDTGDADQNQDGRISLDELYDYTYTAVRDATPNQTPRMWLLGLEGTLHIARRRSPIATPAPLPDHLQQLIDSPLSVGRLGAIDELVRLLNGRHLGLALGARQALEQLMEDDSRRVSEAAAGALGARLEADHVTRTEPPPTSRESRTAPEPVPSGEEHPPATIGPAARPDATTEPAATPAEPVPVRPDSREASYDGVGADNGTTQDRNVATPARPPAVPPKWRGRRRRIALVIAAVIALGAVTGSLLWFSAPQDRSPGRSSTAAGCGAIKDEFDTARLASGWEQLNGGRFALGGGAMAITASDGADIRSDLQGAVTAPFLARTVRGDFSVETAVTVDPQYSYQGAGLLLYRDRGNYVRLERGFGSRGAIAFEYAADGRHTKIHGPFSRDANPVTTSATVLWLRLVRTGTSIKGFWHPAHATTWQELSGTAPLAGGVKAGVAVLNRSQPPAGDPARKPLTATFSYVDVAC